jgi:hypothetical protein
MAGNTLSWTQRIKNSLSSFYAQAVSYCSLKKQPQSFKRNAQVSAILAADTNSPQKRHEQIRMMPWTATLKSVPAQQENSQQDDIQNALIITKKIPLIKQPAHLIECNDPALAQNFADFYAKEYARMLSAQDGIITNHTPAVEIPVKHSGLSIIKRSDELYKEHKLARYSYDKNTPIHTIVINGKCKDVNQMIVHQHEEQLSHPSVYVTLKNDDRKSLENAQVTFDVHGNKLFVKIIDADQYNFELHLPRRIAKPEIKYITQQAEPLQVIKQ